MLFLIYTYLKIEAEIEVPVDGKILCLIGLMQSFIHKYSTSGVYRLHFAFGHQKTRAMTNGAEKAKENRKS